MQDQTPRRYEVKCDDCKSILRVSRPEPETLPAHSCDERRRQREAAQPRTYHSDRLGAVTIPEE